MLSIIMSILEHDVRNGKHLPESTQHILFCGGPKKIIFTQMLVFMHSETELMIRCCVINEQK